MRKGSSRRHLFATTILRGMVVAGVMAPAAALAQTADEQSVEPVSTEAEAQDDASSGELVVTGSRIRRVETSTAEPVGVVTAETVGERGYINAAEAINDMPQALGSSGARAGTVSRGASSGREFVNLFNIGTQRTLTLVNGRRFVSANPAGGGQAGSPPVTGNQVDMNNVPMGLIERMEFVQASGAATYGSDAIAGVVNVILKKNYQGLDLYAQTGISTYGDYPRHVLRLTAGQNFLDDRANVAVNIEWGKTGSLLPTDRHATALGTLAVANPANKNNSDGIPARIFIDDYRVPEANRNGVIYLTPNPALANMARLNGSAISFSPGGAIVPHNIGEYYGIGNSRGGDGFNFAEWSTLFAAVERLNVTALGNYRISDNVRFSAELLASTLRSREPVVQPPYNMMISSAPNSSTPISINNPYLTPAARNALTRAGVVNTFYLSRIHEDIIDQSLESRGETYRALIGIDGDFNWNDRSFYWNVSVNRGENYGTLRNFDINQRAYNYAVDSVDTGSGIVCRVTRDNPGSADPLVRGCEPIDLFGYGAPSQRARDYLSLEMVTKYKGIQTNAQANFGGQIIDLPGGMASFNIGWEYRKEESEYNPNDAVRLGLGRASAIPNVSGSYNTNEFYGEVLVPLLGGNFTLPLITSAEMTGAYRTVDNSLAGKNKAWSIGGRVSILDSLTLRGSKSSTFRAPSLYELFLPKSTQTQAPGLDPCDQANIGAGSVPQVRTANCQAAFVALGLPANFQLNSRQNVFLNVTAGGNVNLRNELANSWTAGFVFQPKFVPGLTLTADRVNIKVEDAITNFNLRATLQACYDNSVPSPYCANFRRGPDGLVADGSAVVGFSNAGHLRFEADSFAVDYTVPVDRILGTGNDLGRLNFSLNAMHIRQHETSASGLGFDAVRSAGTISSPEWSWTGGVRYSHDGFKFGWTTKFVSASKFSLTDTIEQRFPLGVKSYMQHDAMIEVAATDKFSIRGIVNNVFNTEPPYGTTSIGSLFGRYFYISVNYKM